MTFFDHIEYIKDEHSRVLKDYSRLLKKYEALKEKAKHFFTVEEEIEREDEYIR